MSAWFALAFTRSVNSIALVDVKIYYRYHRRTGD
jgi:hypothetical protein